MPQQSRTFLPRGLVLLVALLATAATSAQVVDEANAGIQISFSEPGARNLALGGAFLGLADDASAAFVNPAGLTVLDGSLVDLELRESKLSQLYTAGGHFAGSASYFGVDTRDGLAFGHRSSAADDVAYLSYVWAGKGWALGAFHHKAAGLSATFGNQGAFVGSYHAFDPALNTIDRQYPSTVAFDLEATASGLAVAFDLGDRFSVGVTAVFWQLELDSLTRLFYFDRDTSAPPQNEPLYPPAFYAAPLGDAGNVFSSQIQHADDDAFGFNLGLHWRPTDSLSIGAAYRQGTEYELEYARRCGPRGAPVDGPQCAAASAVGTFAIPTRYGLGVAFRPTESLTLTLDYDRVTYSEMTDNVVGPPELASELGSFELDDADEVHIGLEYVFRQRRTPVSVRGGLWLDPAHQMTYRGGSQDPLLRATWAAADQAEDETHLCAGVGWLIADRFRVDVGWDMSDRVDTLSAGASYRF